jgi:type I restriction enzyme R subunit
MNEAETRAEYIDPELKAAGWGVVTDTRIRREYAITPGRIEGKGRRGKPLTADYILEYRDTKLAVVEAKAWDCALTEGLAQAKNYADKMAIRYTYFCASISTVISHHFFCRRSVPANGGCTVT